MILSGGVVTGILGTLLGIGGSIFLIPYLVLFLHIPIHQAIATGIVSVIATSTAGAAIYLERRFVNIRLGMFLEVATTIGAILGGLAANTLGGTVLSKAFAALLFAVAAVMIWRIFRGDANDSSRKMAASSEASTESAGGGWIQGGYYDPATKEEVKYRARRLSAGFGFSFLAGNLSGMFGIGGGIVKVPVMNLLCSVPIRAATATSNFTMGVTAVASAFIYYAHNQIHPVITSAAVLGVLVGSTIGTAISARIHGQVLTLIFTFVVLFVAVQMMLR